MAIDPKVFKQVRKALGLTQEGLADALGLSRVTINRMERGKLVAGIPDEIGGRLMSLNKRPTTPNANAHKFVTGPLVNKVDAHLWDNEEDES